MFFFSIKSSLLKMCAFFELLLNLTTSTQLSFVKSYLGYHAWSKSFWLFNSVLFI